MLSSGALPAELRPPSGTPGWSRTSGLCRRRAVLFPLSYGRVKEPPAGVEPAPRPYKGRVLAVDTTEAKARTGGVEPPQHEAARLQPVELTDAQRPRGGVTDRTRTGTAEAHNLGCSPLTPRPPRAGTTGLEPATSRLTSERSARLSYAPERDSAGGIRTHDLELMRLARTAAPLPRSLAGRSRTCDLRRPKPVGWPAPLQPEDERVPPAGFEPAPSGLRARRHHRFDHGGRKLRRQGSNLRLASNSRACCPLHHAGITEAAGLEPASGDRRLRASNALPFQLGHASNEAEGEGVEPPRPEDPPVFETGYRAGGSPSESGPGRRRTCTIPGKNRELCRLSYGAEVWPAGIEPAPPRVSGGRSTG
jgi:hypothetical protein